MADGKIIDTPWYAGGKAEALRRSGVGTVIRYYNFQNSSALPQKRLTLVEAEELCAAGLQLGAVFQQRQNQFGDFSKEKGARAGRKAFEIATDEIGQPEGTGIYFSVDYDATKTEIASAIQPYFEGVREGMAAEGGGEVRYKIGAYGSGLVCETLRSANMIDLSWLSMSRGFTDTRTAIAAGDYDLNQIPPATMLLGLGIDYNEANPDRSGFGGFVIDVDARPETDNNGASHSPGEAGSPYVVTARSGLRLRAGPGTEFDIAGTMPLGTKVQVISVKNDWAKIDRDGDGAIDGFAYADYLRPA